MRPRLRTILALHGDALLQEVARREPSAAAGASPLGLIAAFAEADPSVNKSAVQWLVRTYIAGGFLLEDLGKVTETLELFRRHKRKLSVEQRSLDSYKSLGGLWKAVRCFAALDRPLEGREARRAEREAARRESRILVEAPDGFTVVVPLTERAARFWGRGTRWCTAAEANNHFRTYDEAPLFVILLDDRKSQMYASEDAFQLMDEDDAPAREDWVERLFRRAEWLFRWVIGRNPDALGCLPVHLRNREICEFAVSRHGKALWYVPPNLLDDAMCRSALAKNPRVMERIPAHLRVRDICEAVVLVDGSYLRFVPEPIRDAELCNTAVERCGLALHHVPVRLRTQALCSKAVSGHGGALKSVPADLIDRDLCMIAVRKKGSALEHVPVALRDRAMCELAVATDGMALRFVPPELRDETICLAAIGRTPDALSVLDTEHRTPRLCAAAVGQDGLTIRLVSPDRLTRELCEVALRNNGHAVNNLPRQWLDRGLCEIAVSNNGKAIMHVPDALCDASLARTAVTSDPLALLFMPRQYRTKDLCELAVSLDPSVIRAVPDCFKATCQALAAMTVADSRSAPRWEIGLLDEIARMIDASPCDAGHALLPVSGRPFTGSEGVVHATFELEAETGP